MNELLEQLQEDELTHLIVARRPETAAVIYFPPPEAPLAAQRAWLSVMSRLPATARISISMAVLSQIQKMAGVSGAEPADVWQSRIEETLASIESYQSIVREMKEAFEVGQQRIKSNHASVVGTVQRIRDGYAELQQALHEHRVR